MITHALSTVATVGGATLVAVCAVQAMRNRELTHLERSHVRAITRLVSPVEYRSLVTQLDEDFGPRLRALGRSE
jgi:hypothetical protein